MTPERASDNVASLPKSVADAIARFRMQHLTGNITLHFRQGAFEAYDILESGRVREELTRK